MLSCFKWRFVFCNSFPVYYSIFEEVIKRRDQSNSLFSFVSIISSSSLKPYRFLPFAKPLSILFSNFFVFKQCFYKTMPDFKIIPFVEFKNFDHTYQNEKCEKIFDWYSTKYVDIFFFPNLFSFVSLVCIISSSLLVFFFCKAIQIPQIFSLSISFILLL